MKNALLIRFLNKCPICCLHVTRACSSGFPVISEWQHCGLPCAQKVRSACSCEAGRKPSASRLLFHNEPRVEQECALLGPRGMLQRVYCMCSNVHEHDVFVKCSRESCGSTGHVPMEVGLLASCLNGSCPPLACSVELSRQPVGAAAEDRNNTGVQQATSACARASKRRSTKHGWHSTRDKRRVANF